MNTLVRFLIVALVASTVAAAYQAAFGIEFPANGLVKIGYDLIKMVNGAALVWVFTRK